MISAQNVGFHEVATRKLNIILGLTFIICAIIGLKAQAAQHFQLSIEIETFIRVERTKCQARFNSCCLLLLLRMFLQH